MEDTRALIIEESGMRFGPFLSEDLYHIEASRAYATLGSGFSSVEFVCMKQKNEKKYLYFIEAKSSSPNPENGEERFYEWIDEVSMKFKDSLQLFMAAELGIQSDEGIGQHLLEAEMAKCAIKLILVLSQHKKEWLPPVRDALSARLRRILRIWKAEIIALNRDMAHAYGLVQ